MNPVTDPDVASRLRSAFELYALGLAMMRQNLRREFANDTDEQIQQRLLEWRLRRRDAPGGDGQGHLVAFPRKRP